MVFLIFADNKGRNDSKKRALTPGHRHLTQAGTGYRWRRDKMREATIILIQTNKNERTMEVKITNENFESLKNGDLPLVVDFWATWCGPCRMIAPIVEELAKEYDGKINVGKCDVEECDDLAAEYGIRNIPTILFFKGGQVVDKTVGALSKAKLEEKFQTLL